MERKKVGMRCLGNLEDVLGYNWGEKAMDKQLRHGKLSDIHEEAGTYYIEEEKKNE